MLWQWANNRTHVFILDIDGTLMPSAEVDNECFWRAVFECFGLRSALPDLHGFKHVTDSGILREWALGELGRLPVAEETENIHNTFERLLEAAFNQDPRHFSPLPGVVDWLESVSETTRVCAGIATGGWSHSANLKLRLSGLDRFDLPLASSDELAARTDIMRLSAEKTVTDNDAGATVFTYVGDGTWDFHASRKLGWNFIGIASGKAADRLRQAGATCVRKDFRRP